MAQSRALVSINMASRLLNLTRGQIEAAIRAAELPIVQFPGHKFRYVADEDVQKFRRRRLKKC